MLDFERPGPCPMCGADEHTCKGHGSSAYRFDHLPFDQGAAMSLASGASASHQDPRGGVVTELIVSEHVWEDDVLKYAPGDPITQEEADRLGVTPVAIEGEFDRRMAIANENARLSAEARASDMAAQGLPASAAADLDVAKSDTVNRPDAEAQDKALRGPKEESKEMYPGGPRIHPEQDLPNPALEGDNPPEEEGDAEGMTVAELDAAYGDAEGYPKSGSKADKVEFAKAQG